MIVLSIDQAATSGWAIIKSSAPLAPTVIASGVTKKAVELHNVIIRAVVESVNAGDEWFSVVLEDHTGFHFGRGNMSVKSLIGMGDARGRWLHAIEVAGPLCSITYVAPKTWRAAVLGLGKNASTERAKGYARMHARAVTGKECGPDESEAICMGLYAASNLQIFEAPKKPRKRKGAA